MLIAALGTYLHGNKRQCPLRRLAVGNFRSFMRRVAFTSSARPAAWAAIAAIALIVGIAPALAQSGDLRTQEQSKQGAAAQDPARDNQRRVDEFAEAAQAINGPAGNPECVWLGRRVVGLMWRDDLDTAFRHLDLYDRFGCPGGHVQAAFRCLTRFGAFDPKAPDSLSGRVHACWINPAVQPAATTAIAPTATSAQGATPATQAPPAPATK
jgi:hypothetical protein